MKDDNNEKLLRSSLSTLLKRFSNTDLISSLDKQYNSSTPGYIHISQIDDNHVLKKARINEHRLEEVMAKMSEKGVDTPLFIIANEDRYEVVYPRIVYIAAKKMNWDCLPCTVIDINEEDMLVFLATRLRDTKGSNIIELSLILNHLQKKYKYRQKEIASLMNQSRSQITNIMRLMKMPSWVLKDIANEKLSFGHARAISTLDNDEIEKMVNRIYEENLSVREVEKIIHKMKNEDEEDFSTMFNEKYHVQARILKKQIILKFESEEKKEEFIKQLEK